MFRYGSELKAWRESLLEMFNGWHLTTWDYQRRLELRLDVFERYVSGYGWAWCVICRQAFACANKGHRARYCPWPWCRWIGAQRLKATHRRGIQQATCIGCGEAFPSRRNTARYCLHRCRERAYRERVKLKQQGNCVPVVLASQVNSVTVKQKPQSETFVLASQPAASGEADQELLDQLHTFLWTTEELQWLLSRATTPQLRQAIDAKLRVQLHVSP